MQKNESEHLRYYKNKNIVLRKVLPSYFMIDITKCYNNDFENMLSTDEIGAQIWEIHSDGDSLEDILLKFLNILDDEKTEIFIKMVSSDVDEYIQFLTNENCLNVG